MFACVGVKGGDYISDSRFALHGDKMVAHFCPDHIRSEAFTDWSVGELLDE
jgi:hypothetical protein